MNDMDLSRIRGLPAAAYLVLVIFFVIGIMLYMSGKFDDNIRNTLIIGAVLVFGLVMFAQRQLIGMHRAKEIALAETKFLQNTGQALQGSTTRNVDGVLRRKLMNDQPLYYEVAIEIDTAIRPFVVFCIDPYSGDIEKITRRAFYSSERAPLDDRAGVKLTAGDLRELRDYNERRNKELDK